eukprot:1293046-Pleurochrysis_carterae.AAC.1
MEGRCIREWRGKNERDVDKRATRAGFYCMTLGTVPCFKRESDDKERGSNEVRSLVCTEGAKTHNRGGAHEWVETGGGRLEIEIRERAVSYTHLRAHETDSYL